MTSGIFLGIMVGFAAAALALFAAYRLYFLRQPPREIPYGNAVVSPANGVVTRIEKVTQETVTIDKGILGRVVASGKEVGKEFWLILIVLNLWHVHFQRAPLSGTVKSITHHRGTFRNAVAGARSLRAFSNERNEILLQNGHHRLKVIQIAGFLARRIRCLVTEGQRVLKGQTIGLIALGSQVAVLLPLEYELMVREGQPVVDGTTLLAEPRKKRQEAHGHSNGNTAEA